MFPGIHCYDTNEPMYSITCPACGENALSYDQDNLFCTHCPIYHVRLPWYRKPLAWAEQRYWWWRWPFLVFFVILLIDNIHNTSYSLNRLTDPLTALDYGIHELGHYIFEPFGQFMYILGGSLFQCIFPLLWLIGFLQKRFYYAASLCWCWLGLNLFDVATYVADARERMLPLKGPGTIAGFGLDEAESNAFYDRAHDWYQLLSRTGHLDSDLAIAHGLRVAAVTGFIIGITLAGLLLAHMIKGSIKRSREKQNPSMLL